MCLDFQDLNKLIFKDKFPILVIDVLLDELKGSQFLAKLDFYLDYHQIHMKEVDILKLLFPPLKVIVSS